MANTVFGVTDTVFSTISIGAVDLNRFLESLPTDVEYARVCLCCARALVFVANDRRNHHFRNPVPNMVSVPIFVENRRF